MRRRWMVAVAATVAFVLSGCANRIPEPAGLARGTPHVSWVLMSGDRENPDDNFVCQSDPPGDCVVPASRPDAQTHADFHIYFHGAGSQTRYTGAIHIGYLQGSPETRRMQTDITVRKNESITTHSIIGIVTSSPATYEIAFDLVAVSEQSGERSIQHRVPIVVK